MGIEVLYLQYLSEPIPKETFLKRQTIVEISPVEVSPLEEEQSEKPKELIDLLKKEIQFVAIQSDFRGKSIRSIQFDDIRNVTEFSNFEQNLYKSNLIDANYNFIDFKGNKNLLAALYHILIKQNFFRKNSYRHSKNFEPHHFRQYLDYRYDVDTGQQFRKCSEREIEKFKHKYTWIDNITFCR